MSLLGDSHPDRAPTEVVKAIAFCNLASHLMTHWPSFGINQVQVDANIEFTKHTNYKFLCEI